MHFGEGFLRRVPCIWLHLTFPQFWPVSLSLLLRGSTLARCCHHHASPWGWYYPISDQYLVLARVLLKELHFHLITRDSFSSCSQSLLKPGKAWQTQSSSLLLKVASNYHKLPLYHKDLGDWVLLRWLFFQQSFPSLQRKIKATGFLVTPVTKAVLLGYSVWPESWWFQTTSISQLLRPLCSWELSEL